MTLHFNTNKPDHSFDYPGIRVNGVINPEIRMLANRWHRFRMLFVPTRQESLEPVIPTGCEFQLLSKDGYYLNVAPRDIIAGFMGTGNRADWLVRCTAGTHTLETIPRAMGHERTIWGQCDVYYCSVGHHVLATLIVADTTPAVRSARLRPFTAPRPCYLGNMMHVNPDYTTRLLQHVVSAQYDWSVHEDYPHLDTHFSHLNWKNWNSSTTNFLLNDHVFDPDVPFATMELGKMWQVDVYTPQLHPIHIHGNPFQIVRLPPMHTHTDYFQLGDFQDVLALPYAYDVDMIDPDPDTGFLPAERSVIRLQIDRFAGQSLLHCHIYYHSDHGMAGRLDYVGEEGTVYPGLPECYYDRIERASMMLT